MLVSTNSDQALELGSAAHLKALQGKAERIINEMRSFISENPGKDVPLTSEDLTTVMRADIQTLLYIQRVSGSYKDLSYSEFTDKLINSGDSLFLYLHGNTINISGGSPFAGKHRAEDINYYYQGFVTAAAGRSPTMMNNYVRAWNLKQAATRPSFHDLRQIGPATRWASIGYDFYRAQTNGN